MTTLRQVASYWITLSLHFSCRKLLRCMQKKKADYDAMMDKLQREVRRSFFKLSAVKHRAV